MDKRQAYRMCVDLWRIWSKFLDDPPNNDDEWQALINAATAVWETHDHHPLCGKLLVDCMLWFQGDVK